MPERPGLGAKYYLKFGHKSSTNFRQTRPMYHVYLMQSLKNQKIYTGYTPDLYERVKTHNAGRVRSTKAYLPWKLVYAESFFDKEDALNREQALKSRGQAIRELKRRLWNSLHPQSKVGAR